MSFNWVGTCRVDIESEMGPKYVVYLLPTRQDNWSKDLYGSDLLSAWVCTYFSLRRVWSVGNRVGWFGSECCYYNFKNVIALFNFKVWIYVSFLISQLIVNIWTRIQNIQKNNSLKKVKNRKWKLETKFKCEFKYLSGGV